MAHTEAWNAGRDAFIAWLGGAEREPAPDAECPHPVGTRERDDWLNGWMSADAEAAPVVADETRSAH
jgi:hypothetical protein